MNTFVWRDEYKIGHEIVDSQHQGLFDIANQLMAAEDASQLTTVAMSLYRYIREHFQLEEKIMKQANYSRYAEHIAAHEVLLDRMVALSGKIHDGSCQKQDISDFMQDWVLTHILEMDLAFQNQLKPHDTPPA